MKCLDNALDPMTHLKVRDVYELLVKNLLSVKPVIPFLKSLLSLSSLLKSQYKE